MATGLVRYDAMCSAIAACHKVDEAKQFRDKARALEIYSKQARNTEAERKAGEIRLRAERRAGQLLKDMKERGERQKKGGDRKSKSRRPTLISDTTPKPTIAELGITKDQSSQWQGLAEVPEKEFEELIAAPGPKPTTQGILNARKLQAAPTPALDADALWLWGRLCDFERGSILSRDQTEVLQLMTDSMRAATQRVAPIVAAWLGRIGELA
jgi:hypothetical protein